MTLVFLSTRMDIGDVLPQPPGEAGVSTPAQARSPSPAGSESASRAAASRARPALPCFEVFLRGSVDTVAGGGVEVEFRDDLFAKFSLRPPGPHRQRHPQAPLLHRRDHTFGDNIAFHN